MNCSLRRNLIGMLAFWLVSVPTANAGELDAMIVNDFIAAWHTHDVDKIMPFVSDDCHYENVPSLTGENPVVTGRANMRAFLAPFFAKDPLIVPFLFHTEVKLTVIGDEAIASQRIDHFEIGNTQFAVPVAGFFKVKDGKIVYWVDYFDGSTIAPVSTLMKSLAKK